MVIFHSYVNVYQRVTIRGIMEAPRLLTLDSLDSGLGPVQIHQLT